jgi:hypothetical protein
MTGRVIPPESPDPLEQRAPRVGTALREVAAATAAALELALTPGITARGASERLGVGRRLAWHALTLARASEPFEMARARPGRRGWQTLLAALERTDARGERLDRLRQAVDRLHAAIDEAAPELDLDAFIAGAATRQGDGATTPPALLRRVHHASRPSAIFSCRAKFLTLLVTRNRLDPDHADVTALQLFDTIERRSPGPVLPLASCEVSDDRIRASLSRDADLSTVLGREGPLPPVLVEASSPGVCGAELQPCETPCGTAVGFGRRDPRRRGPLRVAIGEWSPMAGPVFAENDGECTHAMVINGWAEFAVFDLLWHREVPHGGEPIATAHCSGGEEEPTWKATPLVEAITSFGRCADPRLPDPLRSAGAAYRTMLQKGFDFLGEPSEAFEHWRYFVECPPMRSMLLFRRPLAERSGA